MYFQRLEPKVAETFKKKQQQKKTVKYKLKLVQ
jgi:hypothetical protein